jgi:hypothetical protein
MPLLYWEPWSCAPSCLGRAGAPVSSCGLGALRKGDGETEAES